MRLVSVNGRVRRMIPVADSVMRGEGEHRTRDLEHPTPNFLRSAPSFDVQLLSRPGEPGAGAIAPRLMMYLRPSATDISRRVTFSSGTRTMNPDVGFGV